MTLSPGWAVGWYFVPILSLWQPYHSLLRVTWLSEQTRRLGRAYAPPAVFPLWWSLWVGSRIAGHLGDSLYAHGGLLARKAGCELDVFTALLDAAAALAASAMVRRLTQLQRSPDGRSQPIEQ